MLRRQSCAKQQSMVRNTVGHIAILIESVYIVHIKCNTVTDKIPNSVNILGFVHNFNTNKHFHKIFQKSE